MYLPSSAEQTLKSLGHQIQLARKRRQWTIADLAQKVGVSAPTIIALEKGLPTVSLGIAFSVLWILGLEKELEFLSHFDDPKGQELSNRRFPKRIRYTKFDNDF